MSYPPTGPESEADALGRRLAEEQAGIRNLIKWESFEEAERRAMALTHDTQPTVFRLAGFFALGKIERIGGDPDRSLLCFDHARTFAVELEDYATAAEINRLAAEVAGNDAGNSELAEKLRDDADHYQQHAERMPPKKRFQELPLDLDDDD